MPGLESLFWRGIRLQRRRGEEKHFLGPEEFLQGLRARNKAAQARQAKTSQGPPPRSDDLQWVWLVSSWSCRLQPWWLREGLNLPGAAPCLSSAWKFRGTYSFFWEIAANNQCLVYWYPLKGNKNQWLEFQGTLGIPRVLVSISRQKGLNPAIQPLKFLLQ